MTGARDVVGEMGVAGRQQIALTLLWLTLAWNVVEGVVAITAGVVADSAALVAFGLDSLIEVTAAGVLIWRLGADDGQQAEHRERAAHRVVGVTFMALALYIVSQAAYALVADAAPDASPVGLGLSIASLVFMPALGLTKRANARKIGSRALLAESTETLVCSYLSLTLLIGLGANAAFGWWWADVAAALAMAPWIVREGMEGLRGETCEEDGA